MNTQQSNTTSATGKYFLWAWIIAVVVFLVFLIITLAGEPELGGQAEEGSRMATIRNATIEPIAVLPPQEGYVFDKLPPSGSFNNPELSFNADDEYLLLGASLQGFYQSPGKQSAWTLNEREYTLAVQLVHRDISPVLIQKDVRIEWFFDESANPPLKAAAPSEAGKGVFSYDEGTQAFIAKIPGEVLEAEGLYNPYPVFRIKAYSTEGEAALLAETAITMGVGPDFGCAYCHGDPQYGVLQIHDQRQGTRLEKQARGGEKVQCTSCHSGIVSKGGNLVSSGKALGISAAIHSWHAPYLPDSGEEACLSCHIGLGKSQNDAPDAQPRRMFMRDVHLQRGLSCVSCHGSLEDHSLALLRAENEAGHSVAKTAIARIKPVSVASAEEINPRVAWLQEPDCTSCHDFENKPDFRTSSAFNKWTNRVGDNLALFSIRTDDTGKIRCISCHGSPHAVYPARNPVGANRDNLQPVQYQQDPRPIGGEDNCAVCHTQAMAFPPHHEIVERSSTTLHVPEGAVLFMPQVRFSHDAHASVDCATCHHKGHEDGKPVGCISAGCHDLVKADPDKPEEDFRYFRNAFHGFGHSCNACHLEREQNSLPGGPTNCEGCHRAPSKLWPEED